MTKKKLTAKVNATLYNKANQKSKHQQYKNARGGTWMN